MRRGKTGYAVEESARGSVSVDALQKLLSMRRKTGYAVEESLRGSAAPQKQAVHLRKGWSWCSLTVSVY